MDADSAHAPCADPNEPDHCRAGDEPETMQNNSAWGIELLESHRAPTVWFSWQQWKGRVSIRDGRKNVMQVDTLCTGRMEKQDFLLESGKSQEMAA
jgi:hypothetical protein